MYLLMSNFAGSAVNLADNAHAHNFGSVAWVLTDPLWSRSKTHHLPIIYPPEINHERPYLSACSWSK